MFCINCGAKNRDSANYCSKCGKKLQSLSDVGEKKESVNSKFVETNNTSLFGYFLIVLKKYAVFKGRARRREYWGFFLFYIIFYTALKILEIIFGGGSETEDGIIITLYNFGLIIPTFAVGVRRMHDVDKSGWNLLIPIYNLILLLRDGSSGDNHYGSDPKFE